MCSRENRDYFDHSVIKYSKSDVCALLKARLECAGPLLEVIVNGIDNLGGIFYGFEQRSKNRSIKFMIEKMNISTSLSEFLYIIVRCGVAHQGMPKIGLIFFVNYDYSEKEVIFSKHSDGNICLNVVGLAYHYLNTIEHIKEQLETYTLYSPSVTSNEEMVFKNAQNEITTNADDIAFNIGNSETHEKYPTASYSAYSAENTLNVSIDSPDQFL